VRWLWRLLIILVVVSLLKGIGTPEPSVFIVSPDREDWTDKVQSEIRQWQNIIQDLPASIEAEIKQMWQEFQPDGSGEIVKEPNNFGYFV